jgi:hypothetical protein
MKTSKAEMMLLTGGALLGAMLVFVPWQLTLLACVFAIVIGLMAVSTFLSNPDHLKHRLVDRILRR